MKLLKYILFAILGIFVFSVFVTCLYEGGFVTGIQIFVGMALSCFAGLGWFVLGIIGVYKNMIRGENDGDRQKKQ